MTIYQIENGKVVSYGYGEAQSNDPSALINRSNEWAAQAAGRRVIVSLKHPKFPSQKPSRLTFLKVVGDNVEPLSEQEISELEEAEKATKQSEKEARKNRKRGIWQKLNIQPADRPEFLRGLKELLEDGNDN